GAAVVVHIPYSSKYIINISFYFTASHYLRQNFQNSIRTLLAIWLLASLILSNLYGGEFYSKIAVPEYETIDTIDDLQRALESGGYILKSIPFLAGLIRKATPEDKLYYQMKT